MPTGLSGFGPERLAARADHVKSRQQLEEAARSFYHVLDALLSNLPELTGTGYVLVSRSCSVAICKQLSIRSPGIEIKSFAIQYQRVFVLNCSTVPMDFRSIDAPLFSALHHMMNASDDAEKSSHAQARSYYRDAKAMAATPADVKEYPDSYAFVIDMPGLKSGDITVQLEEDNLLVISGERKREEDKEGGAKYLRMERRVGKLMRKFALPENANAEAISAVCQDGVLTVTVQKKPPPQPKKPRTIQVQIA